MAREFGPRKNYTFLRINQDGDLYESAKELKEGFKEITGTNGKVFYQKTYKSTDYGKVNFLSIEEKDFPTGKVKYVEMSILSEDGESVDVVQLPLVNTKGGMTDEVKKLTAVLPTIDFARTIIVSSNNQKNDRGYIDKLLYFRYKAEEGDEKDIPLKFSLKFGESGNIPMFEIEEDALATGGKSYNYKAQDKFLSQVLLEEIKRFAAFKAGDVYPSRYFKVWGEDVTETTAPIPAKAAEVKSPVEDTNPFSAIDEDDENPF